MRELRRHWILGRTSGALCPCERVLAHLTRFRSGACRSGWKLQRSQTCTSRTQSKLHRMWCAGVSQGYRRS